jgi:hypothetical protein
MPLLDSRSLDHVFLRAWEGQDTSSISLEILVVLDVSNVENKWDRMLVTRTLSRYFRMDCASDPWETLATGRRLDIAAFADKRNTGILGLKTVAICL